MKSTWIEDPLVENIIHAVLNQTDINFSAFFESNSLSNEERLTGVFIKSLIDNCQPINDVIKEWGNKVIQNSWYIRLYYNDTTIKRGEKEYGADLAFILDVDIPNKIKFKKGILLQAKKMESRSQNGEMLFENTWKIDRCQAQKMLRVTGSSYYILYNPQQVMGVRILPASSLLSISDGTGLTSIMHTSEAFSSTRKFADFILYEFIGCWVGDKNEEVIKVAEGKNSDFIPNHIIRVIITSQPGRLD